MPATCKKDSSDEESERERERKESEREKPNEVRQTMEKKRSINAQFNWPLQCEKWIHIKVLSQCTRMDFRAAAGAKNATVKNLFTFVFRIMCMFWQWSFLKFIGYTNATLGNAIVGWRFSHGCTQFLAVIDNQNTYRQNNEECSIDVILCIGCHLI